MSFWGVGAAEDVLIAAALLWILWKNDSSMGFKK